jgi:hypothetical protein
MSKKYKNILIGYVNERTDGSGKKYLTITNVSDEPITLEPGGRVFLNEIPPDVKKKYPRMPNFSKSVLLGDDDEVDKSKTQAEGKTEEIDDTIPF